MDYIEKGSRLLNSASPWATDLEQLRELYNCPYTAAVTTRTCLTGPGFSHDEAIHQFAFFDAHTSERGASQLTSASLNTLGYSPVPLSKTLENITTIVEELDEQRIEKKKPFIVSITGSTDDITQCGQQIRKAQETLAVPLLVELNLSCPNIAGKPPPAFSHQGLLTYCRALSQSVAGDNKRKQPTAGFRDLDIPVGIKLPPYSNPENFQILKRALIEAAGESEAPPIQFITATNTLGCSLLLGSDLNPVLSSEDGSGIGGLAGTPLHPLALGNVRSIRRILDASPVLSSIKIIGVGGVCDNDGFKRMRAVGADVVALATALGRNGVDIFEKIACEK